jgi:hypothetical protein
VTPRSGCLRKKRRAGRGRSTSGTWWQDAHRDQAGTVRLVLRRARRLVAARGGTRLRHPGTKSNGSPTLDRRPSSSFSTPSEAPNAVRRVADALLGCSRLTAISGALGAYNTSEAPRDRRSSSQGVLSPCRHGRFGLSTLPWQPVRGLLCGRAGRCALARLAARGRVRSLRRRPRGTDRRRRRPPAFASRRSGPADRAGRPSAA